MYRQRLAAHNGRVRPLRILGALAGRQHAQYQSAHNPGCHAALAGHVAGNMALGHMAEFVRQDRSQLGAALGCGDQPQVKAHITAGQSKRVHRAITRQQNHPGIQVFLRRQRLAPLPGRRQQRLPDGFHVIHQHQVGQVIRVAVQIPHDAVAHAPFGGGRQSIAVAQPGQSR